MYDRVSKKLNCILRHSGWTHNDKSLTIFELMAGARFKFMLSEWKQKCMETDDPDFLVIPKPKIPNWCDHSQGTINMLLPLAFTIFFNQKGRYQIAPLSVADHQSGEKLIDRASAWIHPASSNTEERKLYTNSIKPLTSSCKLCPATLAAEPIFRHPP